jgi:hypothetical protein
LRGVSLCGRCGSRWLPVPLSPAPRRIASCKTAIHAQPCTIEIPSPA